LLNTLAAAYSCIYFIVLAMIQGGQAASGAQEHYKTLGPLEHPPGHPYPAQGHSANLGA
jgi:hypothetical protein